MADDPELALIKALATRKARFYLRLHAVNRNSEYGIPMVVIAANRKEAVERAVEVGWGGCARDAQVTIDRIEDVE